MVHNRANQLLISGATALGYPYRATGQNLRDPSSMAAGWSCLGDRQANKQGTLATFLADAVAAGARVFDRLSVEKASSLASRAATAATAQCTRTLAIAACSACPG